MPGTRELLSEFVRNGSERAFRELVNAYIDFVYSTALRIVSGNRLLAEDIAQNVFIDLARKAAMLPPDVKLGGWLHRHTCFLSKKLLRHEGRRKVREQHAVELHAVSNFSDENLAQVTAILDEVIQALGEEDRTAIILRFFEQLDFRSVGKALGRSEDAARMRVSRALEKLGLLLKGRGFTLSLAGLGILLGTKAVTAAPASLASVTGTLALAGVSRGSGILFLVKQACVTKLNAGVVGACLAVMLGTLIFLNRTPAESLEVSSVPLPLRARVTVAGGDKTDSGLARVASPRSVEAPRQAVLPAAGGVITGKGIRQKEKPSLTPTTPPLANAAAKAPAAAARVTPTTQGTGVGAARTPQRVLGDDRMVIQRSQPKSIPEPVRPAVETNVVFTNEVSSGVLSQQPQGNGAAQPILRGDNFGVPTVQGHVPGGSGNSGINGLPAGIYLKERGRLISR